MADPSGNGGERLARLEERTMNLGKTVDRVEGKVDALDGRIDGLEGQISELKGAVRESLGGFKMFAWMWSAAVAVIAIVAPFLAHLLGLTK